MTHLPLPDILELAVLIRIATLRKQGGPTQADFDRASEFSQTLAEKADVLLYGGKKKGEVAELFNRLSHAVAVLSFLPGGVEVFGRKFGQEERKG